MRYIHICFYLKNTESSTNETKSQEYYISNAETFTILKEITNDKFLQVFENNDMVGMQNHASIFYLLLFAESYSHSHHNDCGVDFGLSMIYLFTFHI